MSTLNILFKINMLTIMKKVRNFLIPHEENGHVPHIFSEKVISFLVFLVILAYGTSVISTMTIRIKDQTGAVYASILVDMTNKARAESNLPVLSVNPILVETANLKIKDMIENSYFAHTSPSGVSPWFWFAQSGYNFSYAGENLAVGFNESIDVQTGWMNSPTHRDNILSVNFSEIGIAVADGYYKGKPVTFVVQMFGKPKKNKIDTFLASAIDGLPEKIDINSNSSNILNSQIIQEENVLSAEISEENTDNILNPKQSLSKEIPEVISIFEDKNLSIVKNSLSEESLDNSTSERFEPLSQKKERILVNQPLLVQYFFSIIIFISFLSLIIFLFLEFRAKHIRHALYGVVLIVLTATLSVSNQTLIIIPKLFY